MALTVRTNGSSGSNRITAAWWNDYYNLLTGAMSDQVVTINHNLSLKALGGPPGAATLALLTGTQLGIGAYQYVVTFKTADGGSTIAGTSASITTTSGNQSVSITAIPTGPTGTTQRNIYRTKVGGSTFFYLTSLGDNTTTTYIDTTTDASISTANPPPSPSFGGSLVIKDSSGTIKGQIFNDGAIWFCNGGLYTDPFGNFWCNQVNASSFIVGSRITLDGGQVSTNGSGVLSAVSLGLTSNVNPVITIDPLSNPGGPQISWQHTQPSPPVTFTYGQVKCDSNGKMVLQGALFGFETTGLTPTKLAEITNAGNLIITGTTIKSSSGTTPTLGNSATYDSFDLAESYPCDRLYPAGTIVCPGMHNQLSFCTHDNCHAAMVVTNEKASFIAGLVDYEQALLPVALTGRIRVRTEEHIQPRDMVVSDGRGGVRPASHGFILGVALEQSHSQQVGILIRPMFVGEQ